MSESTSPDYYQFPNGSEVIDVTQWLTGCGAQAVQYVARATRTDGKVKGDPLGDLRKAKVFIDYQIEQWETYGPPVANGEPSEEIQVPSFWEAYEFFMRQDEDDSRKSYGPIRPVFGPVSSVEVSQSTSERLEDWLDGKTDPFEPADIEDLGLREMRVYRLGAVDRE